MKTRNRRKWDCLRLECICCAGALVLAVFAMLCPMAVACDSSATTIRTKADMRLWQTVFGGTEVLSWPWEDEADFATLDFSNRVSGVVWRAEIQRGEGDVRGYCPPFSHMVGGEALVDATLVQKASNGEAWCEVSRETATLAYVSGAGGGPIVVFAKDTKEWRYVRQTRVVAFDPVWQGLSGDSGYFVQLPKLPGFTIRIR